jgi:YfiR/HmsC-like
MSIKINLKLSRAICVSFISLVVVLSAINVNAREKQDVYSEAKIKAAYIYNFLNFVEWPDDTLSVLNICVYGPSKEHISAFNSMPAQTKTDTYLNVTYIDSNDKLAILNTCQVTFITKAASTYTKKILAYIKNNHNLTFSESGQFIEQGGMVNFIRIGSKIRFEINLEASDQSQLIISSKILRIAERLIKADDHE